MQSLLYGLFGESPWNSESVQIPYKIINDSLWAKLTCFPYNNIYIICYHYSTHTWSSGQPTLRRPGSSWGFGALLKGLTSVVDNSCRSRDSNPQPQVTSPTLYSLGHGCPNEGQNWDTKTNNQIHDFTDCMTVKLNQKMSLHFRINVKTSIL